MKYLMKCGHVATGTKDGKPICPICAGIDPRAEEVEMVIDETTEPTKGLEGRKAKCSYCGNIVDSRWTLPFFEYRPDEEYDSYFDGCLGWD